MRRQSSVNSRTVELLKENQSSWSHFTTPDQYSMRSVRRARGFVLIGEPEAERRGLLLPPNFLFARNPGAIINTARRHVPLRSGSDAWQMRV